MESKSLAADAAEVAGKTPKRFVDFSAAQVFYVLLDKGIYLGSISTYVPAAQEPRRGP